MKSLAERLKEREARLAREKLRRSGPVKCFTVRVPYCGYPHVNTDGDLIYIKKRAKILIDKIRSTSSWQFYDALKEVIEEMTKHEEKEKEALQARWSTFTVGTTDAAAPSPDSGVAPQTVAAGDTAGLPRTNAASNNSRCYISTACGSRRIKSC